MGDSSPEELARQADFLLGEIDAQLQIVGSAFPASTADERRLLASRQALLDEGAMLLVRSKAPGLKPAERKAAMDEAMKILRQLASSSEP